MFNNSETTAILIIVLAAFGTLAWGFNRARSLGKLGILAWLQSVVLMAPWLIFFGLFAVGIYLNIVGILVLLVSSVVVYIAIGKQLRANGQDLILRERAAERLKTEDRTEQSSNILAEKNNKTSVELLPISEADLNIIKGIFGIDTFFATETISYQEGAIFKGNLRGDPDRVYPRLSEKLQASLG
jgi:hypothetical protein